MAPQGQTSVMLEIPCNPGDATWQAPLADLRGRVTADLASLGVDTAKLGDETFEARSEYAYPLMDLGYQARRNDAIKALMPITNLIMTGRQGTFRYIFTDTAMEMGTMAADMVMGQTYLRASPAEQAAAAETEDISVFPLAIPLLAGPGAMTTMVLFQQQAAGDPARLAAAVAALLVALGATLGCLLAAGRVVRLLGETGGHVIGRVLGVLLAALAAQIALEGVRESLAGG